MAGAFRNSGRNSFADEIMKTMAAAGYSVRGADPFDDRPALALPTRETSPYVNRIRLLWQNCVLQSMQDFKRLGEFFSEVLPFTVFSLSRRATLSLLCCLIISFSGCISFSLLHRAILQAG